MEYLENHNINRTTTRPMYAFVLLFDISVKFTRGTYELCIVTYLELFNSL
jgi:hypothetical protein